MDAASIRVNASTVKDFAGRIVRVVGKVESYDNQSQLARLDAGGAVDIQLTTGDILEVGKAYEVIGKTSVSDYKVNAYLVMAISDNVNLETANKLASYVQKVPELFF